MLEEEVMEYRRVLEGEVHAHKRFSRITALTGVGLLIGGLFATYFSSLGWLLVLFGMLRVLNSIYDLQREDELHRKLGRIEGRFGKTRKP